MFKMVFWLLSSQFAWLSGPPEAGRVPSVARTLGCAYHGMW